MQNESQISKEASSPMNLRGHDIAATRSSPSSASSMRQCRRDWNNVWRQLLAEPTVHFVVLGGLLFAVNAVIAPAQQNTAAASPQPVREVVIGADRIRNLVDAWTEAWQRTPLPAEIRSMVEEEVRTEVLAREARILGLDRDDPTVSVLLREKMEQIAENSDGVGEPTDADLQAYYVANRPRFGGEGAEQLATLPPSGWLRDVVRNDWYGARDQVSRDRSYQAVRARYHVVLEWPEAVTAAAGGIEPRQP